MIKDYFSDFFIKSNQPAHSQSDQSLRGTLWVTKDTKRLPKSEAAKTDQPVQIFRLI